VNLDEIRALSGRLAELCRKYGIAELAVFGSVARGDAGPDSDVDLLYVRVPGNDLWTAGRFLPVRPSPACSYRWTRFMTGTGLAWR
jgi:predicted nucleotidyltransferase